MVHWICKVKLNIAAMGEIHVYIYIHRSPESWYCAALNLQSQVECSAIAVMGEIDGSLRPGVGKLTNNQSWEINLTNG